MSYLKLFCTVAILLSISPSLWAQNGMPEQEIDMILEQKFKAVENALKNSRSQIVAILENAGSLKPIYSYDIYTKKEGGTFSDHVHYSKSNFFISASTQMNGYLKKFIQTSEHFENIFENNKQALPNIGWQYVIEYKFNGMRFYPWFDADNIMGTEIDWDKFQFYTLAKNNKNYEIMTCSDPSLDVGGLGYVMTCALPIRLHDSDYGLIGVDLSVSSYFEDICKDLGDNLDSFSYIAFKEKDLILLKPLFHNLLLKNVMNLQDLGLSASSDHAKILNDDFNVKFVNFKSNYSKFQLMQVRRVSR